MQAKNYKDLEVWQLAMALATRVYSLTGAFPDAEKFSLTSQMRRAMVSVPSNIAEGHGRRTNPAFVNFLRISLGSLNEVETLALLAGRLGYLTEEQVSDLEVEVRRLAIKLQNLTKAVGDSVREEVVAYDVRPPEEDS